MALTPIIDRLREAFALHIGVKMGRALNICRTALVASVLLYAASFPLASWVPGTAPLLAICSVLAIVGASFGCLLFKFREVGQRRGPAPEER